MHLQIFPSVFLLEPPRQRADIPEIISPESLQKIIMKFYDVAGHVWVELKRKSRTSSDVTRLDGARGKKQVWRPHSDSVPGELRPPSLRPCGPVM